MTSYTFRLFKGNQTFLGGVGALMDLSNVQRKYNYSHDEKEADGNSIKADWLAIGQDMQVAIEQYDAESKSRRAESAV